MTFKQIIFSLICSAIAWGANPDPSILKSVHLEITKATQRDSLFHWKITNDLDTAVYAYDFYLWGPAYHVERSGNRLVIETTPISEEASCPPNRFPPVLLLVIGPHRTIEGDFSDSEIRETAGKIVTLRIAVGADPYSVVAEAKKFMSSGCTHNPYDAIVRWGTILESNTLQFQVESTDAIDPQTGNLHLTIPLVATAKAR